MFRILQMISLSFSVLAAAAAVVVMAQAFRFLKLAREQTRSRRSATLEGGEDG